MAHFNDDDEDILENEVLAYGDEFQGSPFEGIARYATTDFDAPGERVERGPVAEPNPPWHMWGTSAVFTHDGGGDTDDFSIVPQQLARVSYKRPETFCFWFGARLIPPTPGGELVQAFGPLVIWIDLSFGVGRSVFRTNQPYNPNDATSVINRGSFARFVFTAQIGDDLLLLPGKFTSQALSPPMDDTAAATTARTIDTITAQDIQCSAEMGILGGFGFPLAVEVTSFFAPRSHMRPEWFEAMPPMAAPRALKYRGNETGGT